MNMVGTQSTQGVQVMKGSFDDFRVEEVVQVLGLSRQCLRLEIHHAAQLAAMFTIKSGQVMEARVQSGEHGAAAFGWLLAHIKRGSGHSFVVLHVARPATWPTPLGSLERLVTQAKQGPAARPIAVTAIAPPARQAPTTEPQLAPQTSPERPALMPISGAGPRADELGARLAQMEALLQQLTVDLAALRSLDQVASRVERVREDVQLTSERVERASNQIATLEGRVQTLPQLVTAELRSALTEQQHLQRSQLEALGRELAAARDSTLVRAIAALQLICAALLIWNLAAR